MRRRRASVVEPEAATDAENASDIRGIVGRAPRNPPEYNVWVRRCRFSMFRAFRTARLGRAVLLLAAVFAVAGSFGLHPEPVADLGTPPAPGSSPLWTAGATSSDSADPCTACLAHRFVSLTRLSVFAPAGTQAIPLPPIPQSRLLTLSAPRFIEGRAPPSAG